MKIAEAARNKYNGKLPPQAISSKRKTKVWGAAHLEWAVDKASYTYAPVANSTVHMKINYDLLNGKIHMNDVETVINPENIKEKFQSAPLQHYPLMNSKLEVLRGEESKRLFDFRVVVTNPNAISETEENKKNAVFSSLQQLVASQSQSEEEFNQKLDAMSDFFSYEWQDLREVRANELVNHYIKEYNLPLVFNRGFMDACAVGEEMYQVDIERGEPVVYKLNPMKVRIYRSGYSNRVEDADIIVLEDYWSPGRIVDVYHDSLTKEDLDYLEGNPDNTTGLDADGKRDPRDGFVNAHMIDDSIVYGSAEDGLPLYWDPMGVFADTSDDMAPFDMYGNIRVLRMYWKSFRAVKKVKYFDPQTGEQMFDYFPESYVINKDLGEEEEIQYITEAWEGVKIGENIYVNIRPRPIQYNRLSDPSRCHFGIIGTIYNINDSKPYSFVDMMKPYNYMYDAVHDRLNKLIAKSWGKIIRLDLAKVPKDWDIDKWLYFAKKNNLAIEDSSNEVGSAGVLVGAMNNANTGYIDAELGDSIQMHINTLQFLKLSMSEVVGISPQREGQVSNRETVGGVERATLQSSHITEWIFFEHEDLKRRVIEALLETAKIAYLGGSKKFKYILSDGSERITSIDGDWFAEADYGLIVENSSGMQELKQKLEMLAQAGLQNQMITFSTMMKLYNSSSMAEKQKLVERDEKAMQERQAQAQQQQLQVQQQEIQAKAQMEQAKLEQEDRLNMRDNETKILIAQMNADDGIDEPEYSQEAKDKLTESIRQFNEKLALDKQKLELEKRKVSEDLRLKEKQINKTSIRKE